jgi:hypothetical protein
MTRNRRFMTWERGRGSRVSLTTNIHNAFIKKLAELPIYTTDLARNIRNYIRRSGRPAESMRDYLRFQILGNSIFLNKTLDMRLIGFSILLVAMRNKTESMGVYGNFGLSVIYDFSQKTLDM